MDLILIDGDYLEGGGQIVRTAVSLSAITQKPIKIINIRKLRKNAGLSHQHIACVKAIKKLCNATVKGLCKGSETIEFYPKKVISKNFKLDIGTAGSISLVIQALLPLGLMIEKPVNITIKGGTNVKNAPPIDYIKDITLNILSKMGYNCSIDIVKRGFYPEGRGEVKLRLNPCALKPIYLIRSNDDSGAFVEGIVFNQNLDEQIAKRVRKSTINILAKKNKIPNIKIENTKGTSSGIGIFLKCDTIGSDGLGERGIRAEIVGKIAAENLLNEMKTSMAFDKYAGDQMIPFLYYSKSSIGVSEITNHTLTNIYVTKQFLDVKFDINEYECKNSKGYIISVMQ